MHKIYISNALDMLYMRTTYRIYIAYSSSERERESSKPKTHKPNAGTQAATATAIENRKVSHSLLWIRYDNRIDFDKTEYTARAFSILHKIIKWFTAKWHFFLLLHIRTHSHTHTFGVYDSFSHMQCFYNRSH